MDKDNNIKKELEGLSPFLSKMKEKKASVEMPDNYFHYLENSVMQQVQLENTPFASMPGKKPISLWSRSFSGRVAMSLVSVVLLIVGGIYFNQAGAEVTNDVSQFAQLTDSEILNYLTDNAEVLDIYSLSELEEDDSILDMIDLGEGELDYLLEENSMDDFGEEIF